MADLVIFFLDLVTVTTPLDVISRIKLVKINFTTFKMISVRGTNCLVSGELTVRI